ncbi:MAG: NAD-dependent epimerase/dehydratase family protein [Caldilineaceae bacterium]
MTTSAFSTPRNVLIIGGSGFLSGAVARAALARGAAVWTVTRGQRPGVDGAVSLIADRNDAAAFAAAIAGAGDITWDLVVDCIAYTPAHTAQDLAALRDRARHLVFVSTDFVYAPDQRRFPQTETDAVYLTEGYGGGTRQAEEVLLHADAAALGDLRWTVVRPGHIYGPGSQLGCLPLHSRDPRLLASMRTGEPITLVGGGHFLQQPIFVDDLAATILSLAGNVAAHGQILNVAGPDVIESRTYFTEIAAILGVPLDLRSTPVDAYLQAHPEATPFLCHRFYDLSKLAALGAHMPATPLAEGLRRQVAWLDEQA